MRTANIKSRLNGLAVLRRLLGVSQRTMAIYLNVNLSTVKLAELGERSLPAAALIKVAKIEITLKDKARQCNNACLHPAELIDATQFKYLYGQIFEGAHKYQYDGYLLERKLEQMIEQYQKTREKLQILEAVLPEIENDDFKTDSLERQYVYAKLSLAKCGKPAQALLTYRITLAKAQKDLHDRLEKELKEDPQFIANNNLSSTTGS